MNLEKLSFFCSFLTVLLGFFLALTKRTYIEWACYGGMILLNTIFIGYFLIKILLAYSEGFKKYYMKFK